MLLTRTVALRCIVQESYMYIVIYVYRIQI